MFSPMAIAKTFCVTLVHQYLILNPSVRGEGNDSEGVSQNENQRATRLAIHRGQSPRRLIGS